jgi:16S rRNA (cytosine967-C5)-methyltransferase
MRTPDHAVVSETVETCEKINMRWAKGLVNAILREYIRKAKKINLKIHENETIKFAHPAWLIKQIKMDWPSYWEEILVANNERPPMFLRVNKLRNNRKYYIDRLKKVDIEGVKTEHSCHGILLKKPTNVEKLPGFSEGDSSVQDLAAQLAVGLLDLKPKHRVLDACAAPGGKTAHILESEPKIESLTAVEKDKLRAKRLRDTLNRIGLDAHVMVEDIINTDKWWDGKKFDRIILDAPCSATGVIRRHPEIRLLRTMNEITKINKLQKKLLATLWNTLRNDGLLLYVTCSIFNQENRDLIKDFLNNHSKCSLKPIIKKWGIDTGYGRQILPGQDNMDGFFYACLKKDSRC